MKSCNHLLGSLCNEDVYFDDIFDKVKELIESQKIFAKYSFMNGNPDSPKQIVDGRKGYLSRFNYCPHCGEKIDWKGILTEIK